MDDYDEINNNWPREGGDYLGYIEKSIKYKPNMGIADDKNILQGAVFGIDFGEFISFNSLYKTKLTQINQEDQWERWPLKLIVIVKDWAQCWL